MSGDTVTLGDHDPLCPRGDIEEAWNGADCVCDLITRVREEERAAALRDAVEAVSAIPDHLDSSAEWDRDYDVDPTGQTRNPRIWVREAIAAIEALGGVR